MTSIIGSLLIGAKSVRDNPAFRATNPMTGEPLEPAFAIAGAREVEQACALAQGAFDAFRETHDEARAVFLEAIAANIEALGSALIERAHAESALPIARLEGERARTTGQLRMFASAVRKGDVHDIRVEPPLPGRQPLPRPEMRLRHIPLGPVAVFGASNFPLAFSVAGGDTASALATGCPVIVKGHPAHPGTGELVGRAIQAAVKSCGLPEGVFSLLLGGIETGEMLIRDPRIKAVGFTGSRVGGLALVAIAAARPVPIPVYAEMSSINPIFLLPAALRARAEAIAQGFVGSLVQGVGQFCTNPGLVLGVEGPDLDHFIAVTSAALASQQAATMLTPGIHAAYVKGTGSLENNAAVSLAARGIVAEGPNRATPALLVTDAASFMADARLGDEVFGPSSLIVKCRDIDEMILLAESLEGQLTATLHIDPRDLAMARRLLPVLERKAGRILANGWPTGVEVGHATVHGGPFPGTSDSRTTSVGALAIRRFLRPVAYQNLPADLLPPVLR